MKLTRTP